MPGAYPKEMFKSQEDLDSFWNTRMGAYIGFVVGFVILILLLPLQLGESATYSLAILGGVGGTHATFKYNIGGRMMMKVFGPYKKEDYE